MKTKRPKRWKTKTKGVVVSHFTPLGVYVFLLRRINMTDFIIYCDKNKFLESLGDAVETASERNSVAVLIKCGDDTYIIYETNTEEGCYSVKFENPRPNPSDAYVIWTVSIDQTRVDEVVIEGDEVGNTWYKPPKNQCEDIALWFLYQGGHVSVPEYDLDFRPDDPA